ncbi:MAG: hypothetical protein GXP63_03790 [DPANN group archaeon]|nr:hypothetical protein [DPANN group archaeon]
MELEDKVIRTLRSLIHDIYHVPGCDYLSAETVEEKVSRFKGNGHDPLIDGLVEDFLKTAGFTPGTDGHTGYYLRIANDRRGKAYIQ